MALLDPLQGLEKGTPVNLPLTAFCYLVRRLAVSMFSDDMDGSLHTALTRFVINTALCVIENSSPITRP
jgi:hypothetical protein